MKTVVNTVECHPETLTSVLPQLIGGNGIYDFDKSTKTQTIDKLLAMVDETNAKKVVKALVAPTVVIEGYARF